MGDRANIYVVQHPHRDPKGGIFIYTHWGGHELTETLQAALIRGKSRWDDEPYLTRIIIDEVTGCTKETTGVGVTTYLTDNEYPVLVVDAGKQTVGVAKIASRSGPSDPSDPLETVTNETPFAEFIELGDEALASFRKKH